MKAIALLAAGLIGITGAAFAAELKVGVIDIEELVRLHPNTAGDKKLLEQTLKDYGERRERLQTQAEDARKAFEAAVKEAQNPALGEKARQRLEEEAMKKRETAVSTDREYTETVRRLQRDLTDQEVRMLKRTTAEIEQVVGAYSREQGLQLVLQLPGRKLGASSGVVFAEPGLDITAAIMQRMGIKPDSATNATVNVTAPAPQETP